MMKRERRTFSTAFKEQIVSLHASGKPRHEIIKEYDLTPSAFDKWVRQHETSGSFKEKDNRMPEQDELIRLRKENLQLRMENDSLELSNQVQHLVIKGLIGRSPSQTFTRTVVEFINNRLDGRGKKAHVSNSKTCFLHKLLCSKP